MQEQEKNKTLENDFEFRQQCFQKVFGSDLGKLVLDYLTNLYAPSVPKFDANVDYYMLGKYRVIQEINKLVQTPLKRKEKK